MAIFFKAGHGNSMQSLTYTGTSPPSLLFEQCSSLVLVYRAEMYAADTWLSIHDEYAMFLVPGYGM